MSQFITVLKVYVFPLIIIAISVSAKAQSQQAPMPDSTKHFLDTVVNIIHREALNKDSVNWDTLQKEVYHRAENAQKIKDLIPAIRYIFDQLHDNHGAIEYKGIQYGAHKPRQQYSKELMAQINAPGATKLKVKILGDTYGYILIPSIQTSNTDDVNKYAQEIKDSICSISSKKLKGWIIDLRLNPGGNMYPMIGGIGSIIGDGRAGSFVNNKHEIKSTWNVKNGDVYFDTTRTTYTRNKCNVKSKNIKIAVLIGPLTQSSGEATAISLKGRPNTMFFGENTGGYTTGNIEHVLKYQFSLLVAAYVEADRNNAVYSALVKPDILIEAGDNFMDLSKDAKVEAALLWMKKH